MKLLAHSPTEAKHDSAAQVEPLDTTGRPPVRVGHLRALLSVLAVGGILVSLVVLIQPRSGPAALPVALPGAVPAPARGRIAPDFTLALLDSVTPVSLSDLRGQAVILNFWATWCPPCRTEMPDLEAVWREHQAQGVTMVGVDLGESASRVGAFARQIGVTYPIALDVDQRVGASYGVSSLPATYFIDRQGVVRDIYTGGMTKRVMVSKLNGIMG